MDKPKSISVKVVFIPTSENKNRGYIQVRTIANRKAKRKSLGIVINKNHWDFKKQRVLSSLRNEYKRYNQVIEDALDEIYNNNKQIEYLHKPNKNVIDYWQTHNQNTINAGTKANRKATYNKFKIFLLEKNLINLTFEQINPQLVESYALFLMKQLSKRSVNTYLGYFKSVVNKAIREEIVAYKVHPFLNYKRLTNKNKKTRALTIKQLQILMNISLPPKQIYYRDMFCFQILAGGLRVRDLLLLKWENFIINDHGIYLKYVQVKTRKELTPKLPYKALSFLNIILNDKYPRGMISVKSCLDMLNSQLKLMEKLISESKYSEYNASTLSEFEHYDIDERKTYILENIQQFEADKLTLEQNIKMYTEDLLYEYGEILKYIIKNEPKEYVFKLMKGINVPLNNTDEKIKNKIQGKVGIYNYHLDKISRKCDLPKITSHHARHSYAQLMVDSNVSLFLIMQSLGHSGLDITQKYLNSLDNTQLDAISGIISDNF
jgi:integrase